MLFNDRRTNNRVSAEFHVEIEVDGLAYVGRTRNLSIRGVLARLDSGEFPKELEGTHATCLITNRTNRQTLLNIQIIRIAGRDLAAIFVGLDFEQDLFIRAMTQDC